MKISNRYSYEILCEDVQTRFFIYNVLKRQGIENHKIRIDMAPQGTICGSQYVAQKYPDKVKAFLGKNFKNIVLLVCIDADNFSIEERVRFIESGAQNISYDRKKEQIIIWVPKRQIENWIYFWSKGTNEETDYRHNGKPQKCKDEANMMSDYLSSKIEKEDVLTSIIHAKKEFERVCFLQKGY